MRLNLTMSWFEELMIRVGLTLVTVAAVLVAAFAIGDLLATVVHAQTPPSFEGSGSVIDFEPILQQLLLAIGAILAATGTWAVNWLRGYLKAKTGLEVEIKQDMIRKYVDQIVHRGISLASEQLGGDWTKRNVKNAGFALVANYAISKAPDGLRYFGFDVSDPASLREFVEARLPEHPTVRAAVNAANALPAEEPALAPTG